MADTHAGSRDRLVVGAADMIRRRGLNATSVRELAKHAGAPLGSTYHYFPGGKQQVATEAVEFAGEVVSRRLAAELRQGPVVGLRAFLALWREVVVGNGFRAGCPVLAVSVEEPHDDETAPLDAAAKVFGQWESLLAGSLRDHGATRQRRRTGRRPHRRRRGRHGRDVPGLAQHRTARPGGRPAGTRCAVGDYRRARCSSTETVRTTSPAAASTAPAAAGAV